VETGYSKLVRRRRKGIKCKGEERKDDEVGNSADETISHADFKFGEAMKILIL
jgi:hypothetical protein